MYDLLIRNAKVVDGTGNPWFRGDVAVAGASIAAVGRVTEEAARVIEADGLCVCPGFIDVHAHGDFTPFDKTVVDYKLRQGITTEVNGNCGFSAAPVHPSTVGLVRKYVEGFIAPEQGVPWNWQKLRRIPRQHRAGSIGHQHRATDRPWRPAGGGHGLRATGPQRG